MPDRFYSAQPISGQSAVLSDAEAHHLLHVMRAQPGLQITLFDGRGGEWLGEVAELSRTAVTVSLLKHHAVERELAVDITVAVALPKGDRQRWLIEKCVELGATRLVPLTTARSTKSSADAPAKLHRYVIEASKQCGRNRLMEIAPTVSWQHFAAACTSEVKLAAHPDGLHYHDLAVSPTASRTVAVGPEGGFTEEEIDLAHENGWQSVGLGERILRIETAALALLARATST